jgi:hypothetical protein
MSTHALLRFCTHRWALLVACASACVGTPTPEPPDYLPTPNGGLIFGIPTVTTLAEPHPDVRTAEVPLTGNAGAVEPNSDLWIVNLDDQSAPPLVVRVRGNGSFSTKVDANMGDRLRLVSRSARQHSLPLDALYADAVDSTTVTPMVSLIPLPPQGLDCLQVAPVAEITRVVASGKSLEDSFVLTNRCSAALEITNATLRFGDQGFSLATPPASVPVNGTAKLTVRFAGHDDPSERADILLLDVQQEGRGGAVGRYALGVWSLSSSGSGND